MELSTMHDPSRNIMKIRGNISAHPHDFKLTYIHSVYSSFLFSYMAPLLNQINILLEPIEILLKKYRKYIGWCILCLAVIALGYLFGRNATKSSGESAILVLWIILWMPIFSRVFWLKIIQAILPLRKELGILMGILALVHGTTFIIPNPGYLLTAGFWISGSYPSAYAFGILALSLTIPLTLTSNNWSMRLLGKRWKMLHRLVYIIVILVVVHVVLLKAFRWLEIWPIIILILYFVWKILEWKGISFARSTRTVTYPKW